VLTQPTTPPPPPLDEAGVDELGLLRLRIVHRDHPRALLEWKQLGGRMVRAFLAEGRLVLLVAECRRHPDTAFAVERRVVVVEMRRPDFFLAPVGGRSHRFFSRGVTRTEHFVHVRIANRRRLNGGDVLHRIEDRESVHAVFRLAEHRAIGIHRRIAPVGDGQGVQIVLLVRPVPGGDHNIALDAFRPLRRGARQLAFGDPVGPISKIVERLGAKQAGYDTHHLLAPLAGLNAAHPGFPG
jgi:hypothetical protein